MNNEKLGQEPAFACMYGTSENGYLQEGMSKRFYAACMAMHGLIATGTENIHEKETTIATAYKYADELLKQENL